MGLRRAIVQIIGRHPNGRQRTRDGRKNSGQATMQRRSARHSWGGVGGCVGLGVARSPRSLQGKGKQEEAK